MIEAVQSSGWKLALMIERVQSSGWTLVLMMALTARSLNSEREPRLTRNKDGKLTLHKSCQSKSRIKNRP